MKTMSLKTLIMILSVTGLVLTSCEKKDPDPDITADNLKGMFVVCEGTFGQANGDITFYDSKEDLSIKKLYYLSNGVEPGDIVQSFAVADTLGFLVVNNSQKVIVVNMKDFTHVKTIYGFSYPRSVVRADENSIYVSNGNGSSDNYIYSIDLLSLEKNDSLAVSAGPENLLVAGTKIYAALSGGWNNDGSSVIEIDPESFTIANTFNVSPVPIDIVNDKNGDIWVYCKGLAEYDANWNVSYSGMGICKINTASKEVSTFNLSVMQSSGINNIDRSPDGNIIYFLNDGLYEMQITSGELPSTALIEQTYYGLSVDPENGNIVCLDDVNSKAIVCNNTGTELYNFETAYFPNSVVFSY